MAAATDAQVQRFVDERLRQRAEQIRALLNAMKDDRAAFDDIYAALNVGNPTWSDQRKDGPPHLMLPSDVLAFNTFLADVITAIEGDAQLPVVQKACVRPVPSVA